MAYVDWAQPSAKNSYDRLGELRMLVLGMNGDYDLLLPTSRSLELLKIIKDVRPSSIQGRAMGLYGSTRKESRRR